MPTNCKFLFSFFMRSSFIISHLRVVFNITLIAFLGLASCTKIEQTTLGGDLIPVVDNINTFEMFLPVASYNVISGDSTRIAQNADHMAGGIYNDPFFGNSKATLFFQVKPFAYPFKFTDSTKFFDSAVLVVKYVNYYGDSTLPIQFNLYETADTIALDTSISPTYTLQPNIAINRSRLWGSKSISAVQYKDSIEIKRDDSTYRKVNRELRIPLNRALAESIFFGDSATVFGNDSIFSRALKGFALEPQGSPQAFHYFTLTSGTQLQFYYRAKKGNVQDTLETNFGVTFRCGHAVKFDRDRTGGEINNFLSQTNPDGVTQLYIQSAPGTYASLRIPGIDTVANKIIHRASIRVVELDPPSGAFSHLFAPAALYLDAEQKTQPGVFRGIPYDLSPFSGYFCYPAAGVDFSYFGGPGDPLTIAGQRHLQYDFNITRYLQGVITRKEPTFNFRLHAPYTMFYRDCSNSNNGFLPQIFPFQSGNTFIVPPGSGRIKVAGGNHPNPRMRMQLRIIYSK